MKKLLLGTIVLALFSLSICIFQMSCKKEATASINSPNSQIQINIVLYAIGYGGGPEYTNSKASEYWTMNYDGTNKKKFPLNFISGFQYSMNPRLSPDGKMIFFSTMSSGKAYLCSCSIDGSNLKTLLIQNQNNEGTGADIEISGAY